MFTFEPGSLEIPNSDKSFDCVVINGIKDVLSSCYLNKYSGKYTLNVVPTEVFDSLLKHSFAELGEFLDSFIFRVTDWEYPCDVDFVCRSFIGMAAGSVYIKIGLESEDWKRPFTINEFAKALAAVLELKASDKTKYQQDDNFVSNGCGVVWSFDPGERLDGIYDDLVAEFTEILKATHYNLLKLDAHSLWSYFRFPDKVKVACTQYLIYFAQFLADLGISAGVEVTGNHAGAVLFKVVPEDRETSLQLVKEALEAYLNAASEDFSDMESGTRDIAVMQLQSNVMHLQSQLMLAKSSMQMKDATIETLQLSNYQYKQILEQKDKEEDVIPGIVTVGKFESNGISVNLGELLKRLKRRFL
ncbi:hypothetical protein [Pedobacter hiemivivus]|uniref:Uncharacterized protein n=1 Tax=Pedobacter hiemivivus TaxID=2530454 RepID=A0A4R0NGW1_9SPHI|nr:hypothetical protein [Pedobacter hiemivivus]TCC98512.1 hypothetical protein EZ444_04305 [Pedobacter hiemivivus]